MIKIPSCRLAVVFMTLVSFCYSCPRIVSAAMQVPLNEPAPTVEAEEVAAENAAELQVDIDVRNAVTITDTDFEYHIYHDLDAGDRRTTMEEALATQINQICRTFQLKGEDERRLSLAGRVDILRFLDQVDQLKSQTCNRPIPIAEYVKLDALASQLNQTYRDSPYGRETSLYAKTLARILNSVKSTSTLPLQFNPRSALEAVRRMNYDELLADYIQGFLASRAPLHHQKQKQQLTEFLWTHLQRQPVISLKTPTLAWKKLAEIPDAAWTTILDQAQWKCLNEKFKEVCPTRGQAVSH